MQILLIVRERGSTVLNRAFLTVREGEKEKKWVRGENGQAVREATREEYRIRDTSS